MQRSKHVTTAKEIFHCEEPTKDMIKVAKIVDFGTLYGTSAFRTAEEIKTLFECKDIDYTPPRFLTSELIDP